MKVVACQGNGIFSLRTNIIPISPACALRHSCVPVDMTLQDISNPKELLCLKLGSSFIWGSNVCLHYRRHLHDSGTDANGSFSQLDERTKTLGKKIFLESWTSTAEKCSRKDYSGMEDHVQDTLAGWKGSGLCQSSSAITWGNQRSHRQRWHEAAEQLEGAALEASFTLLLIFCPSFFALQTRI